VINQILLHCDALNQRLELDLFVRSPSISSVDLSKSQTVYEDGWYKIDFQYNNNENRSVEAVKVNLNGALIGYIQLEEQEGYVGGSVLFQTEYASNEKMSAQPFLLQYDLVVLSFEMHFSDGSEKELFTEFLLCVSKNQGDVENIQNMLSELESFNDTQIGGWLFSDANKDTLNGLHEGKWHRYAYKSLSSYIKLLEEISVCYKNNYSYFKALGKHTITRSSVLSSYKNVKTVTADGFCWLMQNSDQLSQVSCPSGIQYYEKHYLPLRVKTDINNKSWDVYENRIVVCFLYTILNNAQLIYKEFHRDVIEEEHVIAKIHANVPKEYQAPIITIKSLQVSFCRILLEKLSFVIDTIQMLYRQYMSLFGVLITVLSSLPRKTKTFQEIKPYSQVFEIILRWFRYGEFSLTKDRLILQVKTLDKLFEYYCLYKLLKLFADYGFQEANVEYPVFKYEYSVTDGLYQQEKDVANTYILYKDDVEVTLYYQPVISSIRFENNISLYRTTKYYGRPDYYAPDFVLKFNNSYGDEGYVIFDSKFSSRRSILKYHLSETIRKYSSEMAIAKENRMPKMVWILQGRANVNENIIWRYHNSPLAMQYKPETSYGIISINTKMEVKHKFWDELKKNIPSLQ